MILSFLLGELQYILIIWTSATWFTAQVQ